MNTNLKLEKSTVALIISLAYQKPTIALEPDTDIDLEFPNAVGYAKCMKWITAKSRKLDTEAISIYQTIAANTIANFSQEASLLQRDFTTSRATLRKYENILSEAEIISVSKRNGKRVYKLLEPQSVLRSILPSSLATDSEAIQR